jgi:hypothetical protein
MRKLLDPAAAVLFVLGFVVATLPQLARADDVTPPPVPRDLQVPRGNEAFLVGHAVGTQNYICLPSGSGFAWTLFTPQATLFDDEGQQVITHFFSPNPAEDGAIRATWQDSGDTSAVWAQAVHASTDPAFVASGAVPWVLLQRVGVRAGPTGGRALTGTTYVQRLNTVGGVAPSTGCAASADVGAKAFVPYGADYFFYRGDATR